ncbi:cation:proton antiporter [Bacteroides sp. UBA939]|uniref:cation:proton antiporter domain-containing protein n=1 Tax=Bacteroides sp. UBA939 TaxID=1946092 RepID=UPI0025BEAD2E|nr:cation:proton antiporter [Bacteroides sp. UBA939]
MNFFDFSLNFPITDPTWIFLLVLLIILFTPILLNKLHIPHIIGMILAGLVIGEHGFNILTRDSSFELFGKVGLFYIMFLAGLEMNMADFKKNRGKAVVLGLLAFVVPIIIGLVVNTAYLKYSLITSVLLASMYASHTLVAYPIVIRYGVSRHRSVSIAVGGTAVTDTLTLLVLAVVGGMFKGESGGLFGIWLVVKVILLGGLIMYFFPRIGRWFFRRYDDNVMQFIFVLAMVFLGAGLMELVGMEGILGAFLAGLVLNRLIPHVSPLMNHLEFVGNALFIPYFLIGVGMLIDVNVIFGHGNALKVAGVMIAVALTGKWIACWLTQKIYKMATIERKLMYGLSNAQAAATLAAVLVGYNIILPNGERLLNDDVLNGTVLLILVTCVVSSFITERAARKIAIGEAHLEDESRPAQQEKILIPVANPDTIEDLVNLSLLIRDPKQRDNLLALNVINDNNTSGPSEALEIRGKRYLEKAAMITASVDVPLKQISRYDLNIASGITHTAKEHGVTDVIIGLHRKGNIVDSFFGMLAENLLKSLHREVMIAKFLMPINTIRRINIAVPPKAEYETGFQKWVEHFCRMGSTLSCRVHFFANEDTTAVLQMLVKKRYGATLTGFSRLDDWGDLLLLTGQVNYDHLLVVISARRGSISYDATFERLPAQLGKYFSNNSLIVLYPDQLGEPQDLLSFSNPHGNNEDQHYEKVGEWFYKWFRKSN